MSKNDIPKTNTDACSIEKKAAEIYDEWKEVSLAKAKTGQIYGGSTTLPTWGGVSKQFIWKHAKTRIKGQPSEAKTGPNYPKIIFPWRIQDLCKGLNSLS